MKNKFFIFSIIIFFCNSSNLFAQTSATAQKSPNLSDQGFTVEPDPTAPDLASKGFDLPANPQPKPDAQRKDYNAAAPFLPIKATKENGNKLMDPTLTYKDATKPAEIKNVEEKIAPETQPAEKAVVAASEIKKDEENKESDKKSQNQALYSLNPIDSSLAKTLLGEDKIKSLMFEDEDLAYQERALEAAASGTTFKMSDDDADPKKDDKIKLSEKKEEENSKSFLYLSSIMYYSKHDWTVWLNNKKITSNNNDKNAEFYVMNIDNQKAKIKWTLSATKWRILTGKKGESDAPNLNEKNQVSTFVTLYPNQTFILGSKRIVEGQNLNK